MSKKSEPLLINDVFGITKQSEFGHGYDRSFEVIVTPDDIRFEVIDHEKRLCKTVNLIRALSLYNNLQPWVYDDIRCKYIRKW